MSSLAALFNCTNSAQLNFLRHFQTLKPCEVDHLKQSNWLFPLCILSIVYPRCINSKIIYLHPSAPINHFNRLIWLYFSIVILINHYTYQSFEQDNIDYESLYLSIIILLHKLDMIIWIHFSIIFLVNHLNRIWSYFSALLSPLSILFLLELCGQTQIRCCFCKSLSFEIWCRTTS